MKSNLHNFQTKKNIQFTNFVNIEEHAYIPNLTHYKNYHTMILYLGPTSNL